MTTFEEQLSDALSHAYEIERELGGGGMSRVFVATEKSLGRKVVIKLLSPELTAEVNRGRFRREIQVAAQLQHPHIVTLLSAGEVGELVYYTMPFIRGESLKSALEKNGAMSIEEVVRVLYDVVDALEYAHENGVIHRDIKPANILKSGAHSLVTDFGVAKALNAAMPSGQMTSTGMAIGTPAYMAPEQLAGDPTADHRIDIYAVGLMAYELLTGRSPFAAKNPRDVLAFVLTREPPPLVDARPNVPRRLSEMVMACLSKEREGRPSSAAAMMQALDTFSTASGEIRTREHRVPFTPTVPQPGAVESTGSAFVSGSTTVPVTLPTSASAEQTTPVAQHTAPDTTPTYAPTGTGKSRNRKILIGALALLVPVAIAAIFLLQNNGQPTPTESIPTVNAALVDTASHLPTPAVIPEVPVAAPPPVDSPALADSAKARAARAQEAKRVAAAKADSLRQDAEKGRVVRAARWAAGALLADANASKAFAHGATGTGGLLRKRRTGDLQTQIDALQPFLAKYGLTYDQFKQVAHDSGLNIFDQFGRMVPDSLRRFATAGN